MALLTGLVCMCLCVCVCVCVCLCVCAFVRSAVETQNGTDEYKGICIRMVSGKRRRSTVMS